MLSPELAPELAAYKASVDVAVADLFACGEIGEFVAVIANLAQPQHYPICIKRLISSSLDGTDARREIASRTLAVLADPPLEVSSDAASAGFALVMDSISQLEVDVPQAKTLIAELVARAISDSVLPGDFAGRCIRSPAHDSLAPELPDGEELDLGAPALDVPDHKVYTAELSNVARVGLLARAKLKVVTGRTAPLSSTGSVRSLDELKGSIDAVLSEYLLSRDLREASQALWELRMPYFHHEVVKQILVLAIASSGRMAVLRVFLSALVTSGMITQDQMIQGMQRVVAQLDGDLIKYPQAYQVLAYFVCLDGLELPLDFVNTLPEAVRMHMSPHVAEEQELRAPPGSPQHKQVQKVKESVEGAIDELLRSWSVVGAAEMLRRFRGTKAAAYFAESAIIAACQGSEVQCDLVSHALHTLQQSGDAKEGFCEGEDSLLDVSALEDGITRVLQGGKGVCDDEQGENLAKFLARLVHEKTLPPSSVVQLAHPLRRGSGAASVMQMVRTLVSRDMEGRAAPLGGVAGGGKGLRRSSHLQERDHVTYARQASRRILADYFDMMINCDAATTAVVKLNSPYIHHELVRAAVVTSIQRDFEGGEPSNLSNSNSTNSSAAQSASRPRPLKVARNNGEGDGMEVMGSTSSMLSLLLVSLSANGALTGEHVRSGFSEVFSELDRLAPTYKDAPAFVAALLSKAVKDGCIKKVDLPELPKHVAIHMTVDSPSQSPQSPQSPNSQNT